MNAAGANFFQKKAKKPLKSGAARPIYKTEERKTAMTRIAEIEIRLNALRAHLASATLASVKNLTADTIERLEMELAHLKKVR